MKPLILKQQGYPELLIESNEPDVIYLWQQGKEEMNVTIVKKDKINEFINLLTKVENG